MDHLKKVSIITPFIKKDSIYLNNYLSCLDNQIYENIEIILIHEDDNNVKNSIKQYKNLNIKTIKATDEIKIGEARNIGIQNATGEYLYFLDIDDCIHEHTIYCLVESAKAKNGDIVIGKMKSSSVRPTQGNAYGALLDRCLSNRMIQTEDAKIKNIRFKCNNILFLTKLIKDNNILFPTEINYCSEIVYMAMAYENANNILFDRDAIYFKMVRSDVIRYPSLSLRTEAEIFKEYPIAYNISANKVILNQDVRRKLDIDLNKKYNKLSKSIYSIDSDEERKEILKLWADAFSLVDIDIITGKNKLIKKVKIKEIEDLKKYKFASCERISNQRRVVRSCKKFYQSSKTVKTRTIYKKIISKASVKDNYIMFESFLGKNMSDSPKYIYKYLSKNYPGKYKFIWVFNELRNDLPNDIIQVKRFSIQHLYYLSICKFWVSNMRQPKWYIKKENQIFLETWHGVPLKKLVFDMDEVHSANKNYKQDFYCQSRAWDYLISANKYSTEIFKSAFLFDKPILELGYPRNDLLHAENKDELSKNLKEKLGIPTDKKIVLYAPTWRDDEFYKPGQYKFKLKLDLERLRKELGNEYFFVLRTHYFIADHLDVEGVEDFVYNASKYDDITELYLLSDILITDYSSVFFDYANLKRPMMFFTYDLDKYRDTLRGFYLDMETECPGPMVMNNDELIEQLKNYDKLVADYKDKLENFYNRFCYLEDGDASKRIAEEVIIKNS